MEKIWIPARADIGMALRGHCICQKSNLKISDAVSYSVPMLIIEGIAHNINELINDPGQIQPPHSGPLPAA